MKLGATNRTVNIILLSHILLHNAQNNFLQLEFHYVHNLLYYIFVYKKTPCQKQEKSQLSKSSRHQNLLNLRIFNMLWILRAFSISSGSCITSAVGTNKEVICFMDCISIFDKIHLLLQCYIFLV